MQNSTAQALAEQFAMLNRNIIAWVEGCPDALWQRDCGDDTRTAGVVAHHIASSYLPISQLAGLVANGQPLPTLTEEMFHQGNAQHVATFAGCTQTQVRDLLVANGETAITMISQLSQDQLAREAHFSLFGATVSTQTLIENMLIGHASNHFTSIQVA